ncbi:hypothetical protein TNIN_251671 [Trichonephila inaurata madagascariensis]|uniref:Uncharacterized protein n=1 Tax=Trichonephila inaurata madagascariensis TaxID=2747483 RepID=A0A8X6YT13_9ARAC|nr:hypothetical protein TNIN_251671 [Trichonephila inaurata madagascariensis]
MATREHRTLSHSRRLINFPVHRFLIGSHIHVFVIGIRAPLFTIKEREEKEEKMDWKKLKRGWRFSFAKKGSENSHSRLMTDITPIYYSRDHGSKLKKHPLMKQSLTKWHWDADSVSTLITRD